MPPQNTTPGLGDIMARRATINPYRHAIRLVVSRLIWDLNWRSWISRLRLKRLRDKHQGKKAIILCNGPSLNKVDFSLLEDSPVYTIGLNKINLLFETSSFRPDCIVSMNHLVLEQNSDFYNQTDMPLFLNSTHYKLIRLRSNIAYLYFSHQPRTFARNCNNSMCQGHTVTYAAMQLAYHMGFTKVGLVGCDHNFSAMGPPNATVVAGASDPDHFHPDYFAKGVQWQLPDYRSMEVHYELAREIYRQFGREIFNCTEGGNLEVFERSSLADFIES